MCVKEEITRCLFIMKRPRFLHCGCKGRAFFVSIQTKSKKFFCTYKILLKVEVQTQWEQLVKLKVRLVVCAVAAIIIARIKKHTSRQITIDSEVKRIFPLKLGWRVVSKVINAPRPANVTHNVPSVIYCYVRTILPLAVVWLWKSKTCNERGTSHIL